MIITMVKMTNISVCCQWRSKEDQAWISAVTAKKSWEGESKVAPGTTSFPYLNYCQLLGSLSSFLNALSSKHRLFTPEERLQIGFWYQEGDLACWVEFHLIEMRRCDVQSFLLSILQPLTLPSSPLTSPPPINEVAQQPNKKIVHADSYNSFLWVW